MIQWSDERLEELVRLGGAIHQDEDEPLSEADEARQLADVGRYVELLDAMREDGGARTSEAARAGRADRRRRRGPAQVARATW